MLLCGFLGFQTMVFVSRIVGHGSEDFYMSAITPSFLPIPMQICKKIGIWCSVTLLDISFKVW